MAKNTAAPKVPGEPAVENTENQQPEVLAETEAPQAPQGEETVTVPKSQLDALFARVAALESKPAAAPRRSNPEDLPDERDIDPKAIKSPVLTKQGWVVPETYGANPAAKNL